MSSILVLPLVLYLSVFNAALGLKADHYNSPTVPIIVAPNKLTGMITNANFTSEETREAMPPALPPSRTRLELSVESILFEETATRYLAPTPVDDANSSVLPEAAPTSSELAKEATSQVLAEVQHNGQESQTLVLPIATPPAPVAARAASPPPVVLDVAHMQMQLQDPTGPIRGSTRHQIHKTPDWWREVVRPDEPDSGGNACSWIRDNKLYMKVSGRQVVVNYMYMGASAAITISAELGVNEFHPGNWAVGLALNSTTDTICFHPGYEKGFVRWMDTATEDGWDDAVAAASDMAHHPSLATSHRLNATIYSDGAVHLSVESPGEVLWTKHWLEQKFSGLSSQPLGLGVFSEGESPPGETRVVAFSNIQVIRHASLPTLASLGAPHSYVPTTGDMFGDSLTDAARTVACAY